MYQVENRTLPAWPTHLDLRARVATFSRTSCVAVVFRRASGEHGSAAKNVRATATRLSRVAQLVEQVTVNHRVGGSSPSSGAWSKPSDRSALRTTAARCFAWTPGPRCTSGCTWSAGGVPRISPLVSPAGHMDLRRIDDVLHFRTDTAPFLVHLTRVIQVGRPLMTHSRAFSAPGNCGRAESQSDAKYGLLTSR
jgi:hypothetical protein